MKINQNNKKTIILFQHPKQNQENSIRNQEVFLENFIKLAKNPVEMIDYISGEDWKLDEVSTLGIKYPKSKIIIILNASSMPVDIRDEGYNMYSFFKFFKRVGWGDIYLMDMDGNLYQEINMKKLKI